MALADQGQLLIAVKTEVASEVGAQTIAACSVLVTVIAAAAGAGRWWQGSYW